MTGAMMVDLEKVCAAMVNGETMPPLVASKKIVLRVTVDGSVPEVCCLTVDITSVKV